MHSSSEPGGGPELGLVDVLQHAGFDASLRTKLVRHEHSAYPVQELLELGLLETYRSYQPKPVFHECEQIVALCGTGGTRCSFYGVYWQRGYRRVASDMATPCSDWEAQWRDTSNFFYQLERDHRFDHWSDRIIVEWGAGTRSWHQHLRNKPILEILAPGRKLAAFEDYLEFSLPFRDLQSLYRTPPLTLTGDRVSPQ